jgi:hypothetical protein
MVHPYRITLHQFEISTFFPFLTFSFLCPNPIYSGTAELLHRSMESPWSLRRFSGAVEALPGSAEAFPGAVKAILGTMEVNLGPNLEFLKSHP